MSKLFSTADDDEKRMLFMLQRNFGSAATSGTTSGTATPAPSSASSGQSGQTSIPPNATNGTLASWGNWRDFNFKHKDKAESQKVVENVAEDDQVVAKEAEGPECCQTS